MTGGLTSVAKRGLNPNSFAAFEWFLAQYIRVIDPKTKQLVPMRLYPTQAHFFRTLLDRRGGDGLRAIVQALFGAPKKCGKSGGFAAFLLFHLFVMEEAKKEAILFAWDLDQTDVIFSAARDFVLRHPVLSEQIAVTKLGMTYTDDLGEHTLKRIARDSTGSHGLNPSLVVGDELWGQPDGTMISALSLSPVRLEPLMIFTSYAGYETDMVPGRPLYDLWLKLQPGAEPDPSFFGVWMTDEDALAEVPWWSARYVAQQARVLASEPGAFDRMIRNRWAQSAHGMFSAAEASGIFDASLRPAVLAA